MEEQKEAKNVQGEATKKVATSRAAELSLQNPAKRKKTTTKAHKFTAQSSKTNVHKFKTPPDEAGGSHKAYNEKSTSIQKKLRKDPYPGRAPVPLSKRQKYKRGHKMEMSGIRTRYHKKKLAVTEKAFSEANKQAARTECLLQEPVGYLQADDGEHTTDFSQQDIAGAVDISSAQKYFELKLNQFGPYRMHYTRNGRQLLIGGALGHVAAMDWQTKKLMCEINVMETIRDVKWLHIETMFAVAQKQWTYIYDNQGIELHCLKQLDRVLKLEFLPYHFLLASANVCGYLSYVDVSIGQKVAGFPTGHGRLDVMCQNPANAIIHLGHPTGTVTLWSPNIKQPLVKMLCQGGATRSIAVDHTGHYMATCGADRKLRMWDLRTYRQLQCYRLDGCASQLAFSHTGMLAASVGNMVQVGLSYVKVYKECCRQTVTSPYLEHCLTDGVRGLQFCPFEDVLGVGHAKGFSSLLTPGAGEANFDALEANPYISKKQRQEAEVKMLLEKIQPDMITLDTSQLGQLNVKSLQEEMEAKKKLKFVKLDDVDFKPRYRMKGASKTGKLEQRKQGVRHEARMAALKELGRKKAPEPPQDSQPARAYSTLDRFTRK